MAIKYRLSDKEKEKADNILQQREKEKERENEINNEIKNKINSVQEVLPTAKKSSIRKTDNPSYRQNRNVILPKVNIATSEMVKNAKSISRQEIRAKDEAENINQSVSRGGYNAVNTAISNTLNSFRNGVQRGSEGLANAVLLPIATQLQHYSNIGKRMGLFGKDSENVLEKAYNKILDDSDYISQKASYRDNVNANVNDNGVRTAGNVASSIGNMLPSIVSNIAIPGSGLLVTGVSAGGNAAQETVNEDRNNLIQSVATGIIKGGIEAGTEKITGGNIVSKGSLDDIVGKTIASKVKTNIGKKIANKSYQFAGEMLEEQISDNAGYIVDKIINNKDLPSLEEWWNNAGETNKMTFLTTLALNLVGLGGSSKITNEEVSPDIQQLVDATIKKAQSDPEMQTKIQSTINNVQNNTQNIQQNQVNNQINLPEQQITQIENNVAQNQNMEQIDTENVKPQLDNILNNKELPMQSYIYEKSTNEKINTLREDASKYFNNSEKAHNYMKMLEKIIEDKDINIRLDANLKTADGRVANGSYSNGSITINPNSTRTGEFIAVHELTHAIGTKEMLNMVENYRKSNVEFDNSVKELLNNYNSTEITEEALSDISAQLFGTQEFINNVAERNPNIFKKIYNEIKYLWHQFKGYKNQDQFVNDLYYKWTQAYNSNNKLNTQNSYAIETNDKGYKYVRADRQVISGNNPEVWKKQAKNYIDEKIRNNKDVKVYAQDGTELTITRNTSGKATFRNEVRQADGTIRKLTDEEFASKLRAETHIDELGKISTHKNGPVADTKNHDFAKDGFTYRNAYFEDIDGQYYKITMSVGKNGDINTIYNVGKMQQAQKNRSNSTNRGFKDPNGNNTASSRISSINSITNSNEDVNTTTKYSIQESENNSGSLQQYLDKNFKSEGTKTNLQDIKLPTAPKQVAPSMANNKLETGEYTKKQNENAKMRKHYESIMKSQYTSDEAKSISKQLMKSDTYVPESNNKQLKTADERIRISGPDSELNSLTARAMTGGNIKSDDIAVGERLIQYYSKTGDKQKLQEAIQATAMAGTTAGQTVQAMSLLNHQTPEGQAIWLQRSVEKMNNDLRKSRGENAEQFKLTEDMIEKIVNSKDEKDLHNNLNKVYEELGQQVSKTTIQKIDAWRYFAMLANPRTHIRNIVGNVAMAGTQSVKNKIAGTIEGIVSKVNPEMERTHTIIPASEEVKKFAKSDIENVADRLGLNENKYNPKSRLENSMRTFKSDTIENTVGKAFKFNDNLLEAEDGVGLKYGYTKALSEYMTANNLNPKTITDKQLAKARNYAVEQAKEATFHQESSLATLLNQFSNKNNISKFFMDSTLPFKKTPINVAKAGLEYSPVGLVKSAVYDTVKLRNGDITVNQYIDNVSKGLTGTGIALVGYALASAGILKASGSDDKDKEGYDEDRGNQTYSIKIGDNTYSLDWLAPTGIPLFIGAEVHEIMQASREEKTSSSDDDTKYSQAIKTATNILDAFTNAMNPMTEMSMLSGLTSSLKSYDGDSSKMLANMGTNAVKSYVNQFVPTALSQVAKTTDTYERSTTSTKIGTLPKAVDSTKNYIMSKIPGLRQLLPTKTDVWGNDIKQADNVLQRALENGVFPWTRKEVSTNAVDSEIIKVYDNTGESSVFPDTINKNLTIDKQKYLMTSDEYSKYKKQYGKDSYELLDNLVKSSDYKKMTDDQKKTAIEKVYSYANEQIKVDYAKQNKLDYDESTLSVTIDQIKKNNGNVSNYFEYLALTNDLDKNTEKMEVLYKANFDNNTKKAIYKNSIGKDDSVYQLIEDTNINITEYIGYKAQQFVSDKEDDGTITGSSISGSKKKKVYNYIENMNITYSQKLLLKGMQYSLTDSEKNKLANYVRNLNTSNSNKLEIYSKLKGFTVYKDGTFDY